MNKLGTVGRRLIGTAAGFLMVLGPVVVSASPEGTGDRAHLARSPAVAHQEAIGPVEADCTVPASGHRPHCHNLSLPAIEDGLNQSRDLEQVSAPARVVSAIAARNLHTGSPLVRIAPVAAPPPYILYGNFRS